MLTFLQTHTRLGVIMFQNVYKRLPVLLLIFLLQSCYTLLHPPATQPYTKTTRVVEPAMASSLGGSGAYGWDPYWEPGLPFTSYSRQYGGSYYSRYNYYDYQDDYYAPVYIVGETETPKIGREFNRDDEQGGSRNREQRASMTTASAGSSPISTGVMAPAQSQTEVAPSPVIPPAAVSQPTKPVKRRVVTERKEVRPVKTKKTVQQREKKETTAPVEESKTSTKRKRKRK